MPEFNLQDKYGFTDQLNIETPEQVELRFPIAGIGSRFLAALTDSTIQISAELVLVLLFVLVVSAAQRSAMGQMSDTSAKWFVAAVVLFHFLLYWGYFSLFEAFWNGQTPGKRLLKIRVIKDSGRQITFFEALARNLLRIVDFLFGYLVGVVCMLCNKQQKRLGDFVAGTIVVHERSEEQPAMAHNSRTFTAAMYQPPVQLESQKRNESILLPADAVGRLETQDLNMIDAFLTRALDLEMRTREEMARKIAHRVAAKMQVALPEGRGPEGQSPERFLEAVAYDMRAGARR